MKKTKRLVTFLLVLCFMFNFSMLASAAKLPPNTDENANAYSNDWVYWCQGASRYWGMRGYGCRMVAQSKLLVEAGIVQTSNFNPDVYFEWCKSNGYINGSTMCELRCGQGPGAYAKTLQKSLTYTKQVSLYGSKSERAAQIMSYINDGYYVILGCTAHHAYVGRNASLNAGTPIIYDSWSGYSYNTATVQNYTSYTLVNFSYAWLFNTGEAKETTLPPDTVRVIPVTGNADTVTETSAILRGSFTTTIVRATECGMYLGTDKDNLTKLGSDSVNTYGTSMFYSTSKYGKTLTPGTTYYYQAYATVNGEEKRGSVESFTTKGTTPPIAPTLSVSLSSNALTLEYGTCNMLTASTTPAALPVTWKSTDESVVTVANGVVTAVDSGTAYVIAEVFGNNDQTASAKCRVTVKEAPKSETATSDNGTIIDPVPVKVTVTTKGADNITETSATVRGNVSVDGGKATECGMYFGTSAGDLTFLGSDSINSSNMPFYYSTSKYGRTLSPDTTYYYRAYAVVNGETHWGETASFTTTKITPTASVTVTTRGADNVTQTSATVRGNVSVSGGKATECGMYFGTSASNLTFLGSDSINSSNMPFYYGTSKYGRTLAPGTTYYYRAYAVVNGETYWGETASFTTAASAPASTGNTRTAVVVNTNGQYLAINDRPAASPRNSTQIGRIPPAGTVTVYPDKTSGNWYYVQYNGVSGYAYSKYLSLR